ncbi:MAG: DUF4349 domain-containing protein [Novosphingobium sp.]|nr:DUF4349 domain-containing protein [Novosphingobium sp.]
MKPRGCIVLVTALAIAGCGSASDEATRAEHVTTVNVEAASADMVAEAPPPPAVPPAPGGGAQPGPQATSIPVSIPRIAYVYEYGYRLDADRIPEVQRKHADLCEKQGPQVCRILDMRQSGSEGDYASGSLAMAVAAPRARSFGEELSNVAGDAGGKEVSSAISGEDLSKQIVDTEARLRARTALRDRLMEVLQSRKGTVAELVEAERGVAQVNEEIDQARSWLAEMQGRVEFSRVNVSYSSGSPSSGGFMEPIRGAVGNLGTILGTVFAFLIVALAVLVPLGLVGWGILALFRLVRGKTVRGGGKVQPPDDEVEHPETP